MKKYRKPLVREIAVAPAELLAGSTKLDKVPFHRTTEIIEAENDQTIGWENPFDGGW